MTYEEIIRALKFGDKVYWVSTRYPVVLRVGLIQALVNSQHLNLGISDCVDCFTVPEDLEK